MKKQNGFTLIELVVVIIILGILAVVAAPKFINLSSDAREAALQGVAGSIKGANAMVHAKAQVADQLDATGNINLDGVTTETIKPYVTAFGYIPATVEGITSALDLDTKDWKVSVPTSKNGGDVTPTPSINISQVDSPATCLVKYTQATANDLPEVEVITTGC
ncbi:type II secretion system protein [Shewanella corallii]|uniref:type II secretion system protein n=1 Tax=Shewanella corallii TaxID=560080 RepID=UPI0024B3203F|nr:type II secretion system protein [Shewanella corallii]